MVGMHCMPECRWQPLDAFIENYEHWSSRVSKHFGKDFNFFKQHAASHVRDTRDKATTDHGSACPGEGFQQEVLKAYLQTNCSIARIRMTVDNLDRARHEADPQDTAYWAFGASVPGGLVNSRLVQNANRGSPVFRNFDFRLRTFLSEVYRAQGEHYWYEASSAPTARTSHLRTGVMHGTPSGAIARFTSAVTPASW
ncbi:hypothetical protein DFH07DRAFT_770589 [Mycena maculata]|uniref:Uncharacterized protein n=1 Tax=Mycena maculata TaxID=230809 RepID=A0AAD7NKD3_9AGAR|nr:hypothetical protein DFH07DRAFT_770589 [Mycena maculata]